jgi:hypothetical protein
MFNLIWNFAKANAITILSKVKLKDVCEKTEKVITKSTKVVKGKINEEIKYSNQIKEPRWQRRFPFSFVYGGGKFQPLYFWIFCFCVLALGMLFVKIYAAWIAIKKGTYDSEMISTADLATVLTFISSLILLYNNNKKNSKVDSITTEEKGKAAS